MTEVEEKCLELALKNVQRICRVIRACVFAALLIVAIVWVLLLIVCAFAQLNSGQLALGSMVFVMAYGTLTMLILWNLFQIFQEVVRGHATFSEAQADRLRSIAVIALAYVVLDLIVSFGFIYEPFLGVGFGMVVNDGVDVPTVNINFGMLAFSAIMYSLSAIFRYAALLQQLSDETV